MASWLYSLSPSVQPCTLPKQQACRGRHNQSTKKLYKKIGYSFVFFWGGGAAFRPESVFLMSSFKSTAADSWRVSTMLFIYFFSFCQQVSIFDCVLIFCPNARGLSARWGSPTVICFPLPSHTFIFCSLLVFICHAGALVFLCCSTLRLPANRANIHYNHNSTPICASLRSRTADKDG